MSFEVKESKVTRRNRDTHLQINLYSKKDGPMAATVRKLAFGKNITPTEVVRQVILHCLDDMVE